MCIRDRQGAAVTDGNGNDADVDLLRAGMVVEVGYNGMVMETYPSQIAAAETLRVLSEDEDLVGFYLQVLDLSLIHIWRKLALI